jgi:outer membrane protein
MKKLIIALLMLLTSATTYAQFNKGRMLVGGQLSLNTTSPDADYKGVSFSLAPQFGYFVVNNFAVGAGINYSAQKNKSDYSSYFSTSLQFQPFVRYYFKPGIFVHGSYGIGAGRTEFTSDNVSYNLYSWTAAAGYAIFLNDHVAIEPMLGYKWDTLNEKATDGQKISSSALYFQVGFQIYLGRKD